MADALKCDRCGCFYAFDPSMDLCLACTIKLVRFLKNEVDILEEDK